MARQDIDIGVEGNDGTGDSIRESFRKTNENFEFLYAIVGEEGTINFTSLGDTPNILLPNTIPVVNPEGTLFNLLQLGSDSDREGNDPDTIEFEYTTEGKLIISTAFAPLDNTRPEFKGPLDMSNHAIANVAISPDAADDFNTTFDGPNITIDDLVITKGYADKRYISSGLPIRVADEPNNTDQYIFEIQSFVNNNLFIPSHGLEGAANGTPFVYSALFEDADNLTSGETYYIRYVDDSQIALFDNPSDAGLTDNVEALNKKILVSGDIASDDVHKITDEAFDPSLEGNFLSNVALPRKSIVRRQGDTMTGSLFLNDHPGEIAGFGNINGSDDLQAATKLYVDSTSFSSPQNLFVSTSGDDRMIGVPKGKEGTSQDFAFRSINAAARRAEEIIRASEPEPGPYFQTVTVRKGTPNEADAQVTMADIVAPVEEQARKLIDINREYIVREYLGYLEFEYPDFVFDTDEWKRDIELIIDSIAFDVNRGRRANTLTRRAAEKFYGTAEGRFKIRSQTTQVVDSINFTKNLVNDILQNRLYQQKNIADISINGARARVTAEQNHNLQDGNQVIFREIVGLTDLEDQTAYIRVVDNTRFDLYEDENLTLLFDISSYAETEDFSSGKFGTVYQPRVSEFDSIKTLQLFDSPDVVQDTRIQIGFKFDLVNEIIQDGIDAGTAPNQGNNYKIVLTNSSPGPVDQAQDDDLNLLPGKIIVGKKSGARGRIVEVRTEDPNENDNDVFELLMQTAKDFEIGETVEYGNFVKKKQITLFIESGTYEEDLPIKVHDNVSLKGDEFRRVIVRPKRRVSQSRWANTYFYKELEFDDIELLPKRHSLVTLIDSGSLETIVTDDTSWMSIDQEVKFVGQTLFGDNIEKGETYYVSSIPSSTEFTISASQGGAEITLVAGTGIMYVVDASIAPFLNQTNQIQGYFGRHYLEDFTSAKNTGSLQAPNVGNYSVARSVLELNKSFLVEEFFSYIISSINAADQANDTTSKWFDFSYDTANWLRSFTTIIDSINLDLERGGAEFALQTQGDIYRDILSGERDQFKEAVDQIIYIDESTSTIVTQLLGAQAPSYQGNIRPDVSLGAAEEDVDKTVGNLKDLILFAFDVTYNPPLRNNADGMDVFLMGDATILRNITVQGQGGFMVVLDPESQILTKSPYIQTGSSFSKSDNEKRFRGGMYVDAFVGNIPAVITQIDSPFKLRVESEENQGLNFREPPLPAPFYLDGIRYQINNITEYDGDAGTAIIFLDENSNNGQGYLGSTEQEIFIQSGGNRSMLGNDFTQINDLGYGLVTNNGAFSEMVSMFTYYCQAAYYAKNGSEIRSLNGSNGYGNFGLVAEGADPNEIPDQVTLTNPMTLSCKAFTTTEYTNAIEEPFITAYDFQTVPTAESILTIDHGPSLGVLNYRISSINNLTQQDGVTATNFVYSGTVYRLSIKAQQIVNDDFFGSLQDTVNNDTYLEFRNAKTQIFSGVRNTETLNKRPSTAINFDESDLVTYRSLNFSTSDSLANQLPSNTILARTDTDYDLIELPIDVDNISGGFGSSQGDTTIAVRARNDDDSTLTLTPSDIERLTRDIAGRQPGDPGYQGGMIFSFTGKTHQIIDFTDDSSVAYIEIQDVSGTNINDSYSGTGLNAGLPLRERSLFAGLPQGATAEITQAISLLRATGHDFTQIGAGSYNDSNYPNVIFGSPQNSLADAYESISTATSAQVWERRKGRVFFVTTDQDGYFRVGKFFTIDQATGSIQFAGDLGLTNAESLGFSLGTVINEFSTDSSFVDNSPEAVPTEKATGEYISRVLGINLQNNTFPSVTNRIGPGFLPLSGDNISMEGSLDLGDNKIENLAPPTSDSDAATKKYVDEKAQAYDELNKIRNIEFNSVAQNDILVATGNKRIFTTPFTGGSVVVGDLIGTVGQGKTGTVIDIEQTSDDILGNINVVTYTEGIGIFQDGDTIFNQPGETATAQIIGDPVDEFANASESNNSVINVSITRNSDSAEYNLQIQDDSLTNADVNSSAAILQSKLNLQKADTFNENDATTGWDGTADKLQSDLGLAKFSDENFDTDNGFVRIKANGIEFEELKDIPQYHAYGRQTSGTVETAGTFRIGTEYVIVSLGTTDFTAIGAEDNNVGEIFIATGSGSGDGTAATTGDPEAVSYNDIVKFGNGLEDGDFDNTVDVEDETNPGPGEALVKIADGIYGTTAISIGVGGNTIARRDKDGALDARELKIDGNNIITAASNTIRFDTPGGARVFSAEGTDTTKLTTVFPGNINVGESSRTEQSFFQSETSLSGEGWLASDWIYTSFIEAAEEGDTLSTGIALGPGSDSETGEDTITFFTGGDERVIVSDTGVSIEQSLTIKGNVTLGNETTDTVTFTSRINSDVLPASGDNRNLGSSGTRWDVMYANIFNGVATEAKYADLAEKYTADSNYESGTVVVFGGEQEVTVTDKKGDRRIAGLVSANPAYLMNSDLVDGAVAIALQGRVPCKVLGRVAKGDMLVSSAIPGYAVADNNPSIGTVIGKSLEDKTDDGKSVIEIVVGRT
jgi:hypothetical protein